MIRALLAVLLVAALAGCSTKRTLTIDSDPGGARVWVNGRLRGVTPVNVPFVHPSTWNVRLEKAGYASLAEDVGVHSGIGDYPIVDLPYELLVRENRWRWVGKMTPLPARPGEPELQSALDRAREFRDRTRRETAEGVPAPRSGR